MKPQEAELVSEISKLQSMVSELRTGFTSALRELSQIQHGDTYLREELEENRRSCQKKALRLEVLVEALREELGVMSLQVVQLSSSSVRPQQDAKSCTCKQRDSGDAAVAAMSSSAGGRPPCECSSSSPSAAAGLSRGKLLLHCFLQGLKAGLNEGTDARHQVAMQLLHSEWEYVSTLNQLYDTYQSPAALQMRAEPHQTYLKLVEQLQQRHVAFRNTLQERLSAEHWKSLVGDILVQLIGHNDTAFSDMYVGYTTTLASFIQLEFNRLNQKSHKLQGGQVEKEEMKLLSSLLAPVARLHGYLSHIQNLLQWTRKEHPDCSLLLGTERALRSILTRCHVILEEEVRWEEEEGQRDGVRLTNGVDGCHSMRLECWSCSPVRRKGAAPNQPAHDCGHAYCSLLTPEAAGWGENSDSGQGTFSQLTGKDAPPTNHSLEDGETDPDDTSAFDYSSVTSCSPDGTLRREALGSHSGGEEEEDSQVPVLLKPSYSQQPKESPRERTVCVRWQIPRLTPHPPLRKPARPYQDGPAPCLVSSYGSRLVSVRRGSPPLHPKSAFRPIWDDPSKQADAAPEKDSRPGFVPIRPNFQNFPPSRESLSVFRPGPAQQRGNHAASGGGGGGGVWDDSEDSEGPCSTV